KEPARRLRAARLRLAETSLLPQRQSGQRHQLCLSMRAPLLAEMILAILADAVEAYGTTKRRPPPQGGTERQLGTGWLSRPRSRSPPPPPPPQSAAVSRRPAIAPV